MFDNISLPVERQLDFSDRVPKPLEDVWAVIGDFGGLSKWASRVTRERLETCGDDVFRIVEHSSGAEYRERLVASGPYSYTYSTARTGTSHYEATISAEAAAAGGTTIRMSVLFRPGDDVDAERLEQEISRFFAGSLTAMKRAIEA